jgi:hypothetical protein
MGTNYYVTENECECCKRYDEKSHIGKASHGWAFTFQGYKHDGLTSWQKWKEFLKGKPIRDEYGDLVPYDEFVKMIETEKSPSFVRKDGHKNLVHNDEGRREGWFNSVYDWDCPDGYSFSSRDFS